MDLPRTTDDLPDAPAPMETRTERRHRIRGRQRSGIAAVTEWVLIVSAALAVALFIKAFVLQAFYIPSGSMERTLMISDRVLVNKLSYRMHDVHRGDIVVFSRPAGEDDPRVHDLIKRVIGLPGETVESRDGRVLIDGHPLDEPYLRDPNVTSGMEAQSAGPKAACSATADGIRFPCVVPRHHYWVMGDNLIVGRAFIRLWPLSHIRLL